MSRPVFSFRPNMEQPDHRRAWEILQAVPEGKKNQYLVQLILKSQEEEQLEKLIRQAVREELKDIQPGQATVEIKEEIPDVMLDFLSQMEG